MTASLTAPTVAAVTVAIRAALIGDLTDWTVLEGVDPQQAYLPKSVTIGGRWDPDVEAFTGQEAVLVETTESGAARRVTETTSIDCLAYAGGGDLDPVVHRTAVNDALTAVRGAVRAITRIDGVSARAQMSAQQWLQARDEAGAGVMAAFTIMVATLP